MSFGGMILKEGKTWISRPKREGKRMKNGGENRLGVTLVTAKNQKSCWKVRVRTRAWGILRRCLTVGWSQEGEDRAIWKGKDYWEKGRIARGRIARLALLSQYFARSSYQKIKCREEKVHFFDDFSLIGAKSTHICIGSNRKVRGANEMVFWIAREVFSRKTTCISAFFRIFACLISMDKKDQHIDD